MAEFSEWQLKRLRERLNAYRMAMGPKERGLTWPELANRIDKATGTYLDPENHLRLFVLGTKRKDGAVHYRIPMGVGAIKDFLMGTTPKFLHEEEFAESNVDYHPALGLASFFGSDYGSSPLGSLTSNLEGQFKDGNVGPLTIKGLEPPDGRWYRRLVSFDAVQEANLIKAFDVTEEFMRGDVESERELRKFRKSHVRLDGWAVLTAQGQLLVFLKDDLAGKTRMYFAWLTGTPYFSKQEAAQLVLLEYDKTLGLFGELEKEQAESGSDDFIAEKLRAHFGQSMVNLIRSEYLS